MALENLIINILIKTAEENKAQKELKGREVQQEKKKEVALTKCKNDYENSSDYVNGGYCEIK